MDDGAFTELPLGELCVLVQILPRARLRDHFCESSLFRSTYCIQLAVYGREDSAACDLSTWR